MYEAELEAYYDRLEKLDQLWADDAIATDDETTTTTEITDDATTSPDEF